ncbi:DUF5995 family protein [Nocardia sp. SSK8]|uniref:DUF5995 family protein n=1 Tax=Nocardia sp. SSK8 TaxID=3120154 RepID=UPI00300A5265
MFPASVTTAVLTLLLLVSPAVAAGAATAEAPAAACGTSLTSSEITEITDLSEPGRELRGDSLARLEDAVVRHHRITDILVRHLDMRGVFALGLDAVEHSAVMPMQRDPNRFRDPEFAHAISYDLLRRFLDNVHAEFSGGTPDPHWAHYFALAADCGASRARVAMAGYNAHLVVDLADSVAAVGAGPEDAEDYFDIVAAIASSGDVIVDRTEAVYDADLGPLWRFYFLGEGLDRAFGAGVASRQLLITADLGANAVIFSNGLALQNPALEPAIRTEIDLVWRTADATFEVLARAGAL